MGMIIFSVLSPSSGSLVLRTFQHRPIVLGKIMISDLAGLSLRYSFYLTWPVIYSLFYQILLWFSFDLSTAPTSLTIHLSRNMTTFAFYNTPTTRFTSYSLPLANLQAPDFRFLGPHFFLLGPLCLGNVIHTYCFKYLLSKRDSRLQFWPWSLSLSGFITGYSSAYLSLRYLRVTSNAGSCQNPQKKSSPHALRHYTYSLPLFPTSCSWMGLHPWSLVC